MKRKIKNQFILYFSLLAVCPLLILAAFSYYNVRINEERKLYNSIEDSLKQNQNLLSEQYSKLAKYMDIVSNSYEFYDVIHMVRGNVKLGDYDVAQFNSIVGLDKYLKSMFLTDDYITQVMIFVHGRCVYSYNSYFTVSKDLKDYPLMKELSNPPKLVWKGFVENPFDELSGTYTIVSKDIRNTVFGSPTESICQFVIMINQNKLTDNLIKPFANRDDVVAVVDDANQLLAISTDTMTNRNKISSIVKRISTSVSVDQGKVTNFKSGDDIVTYCRSDLSDWKIIILTPQKYLNDVSSPIVLMTIGVVFVLLSAMLLFSWVISRKIFRPIQQLASAMVKVGEKNFSVSMPENSEDEIGEICKGFNDMVANIDSLFKLTVEKENQKRQFEINMLKYQINPHFLYNTLNSIRYAALTQDGDAIANMIMVLSRLLRNTLVKTGEEINLEQELDNIRDYLFLQQIRYSNGITVLYDIDRSTLSLSLPGMILQPIVENSIMHGLNESLNSCEYSEIRISSRIESCTTLVLSVMDNGSGILEDKLDEIFEDGGCNDLNDSHIGLNNIHKRIRLQYGAPYGLSLESKVGVYTCIKILLPVSMGRKEKQL